MEIFIRMVQMRRFVEGDEAARRRKLEVVTQLGIDRESLSLIGRFLLWWLSLLLRATLRSNIHVPQPKSTNDRTTVPPLNLSECGASYHFGGALQVDPSLPRNYVASTVHMESRRNNNFVTRMMLSYFELGGLSKYATDFTFKIAGEEKDELPERALCSCRIVRSTMNTLPLSCGTLNDVDAACGDVKCIAQQTKASRAKNLYWRIFVTDPLDVAVESVVKSLRNAFNPHRGVLTSSAPSNQFVVRSSHNSANGWDIGCSIVDSHGHPVQKAVNEVVRILEGVTVPVRKSAATADCYVASDRSAVPMESTASLQNEFDQIPILHLANRHDIERYFIAANCCFKTTSVRLVESTAWRARTFPIDTRSCRVELHNGQFFQQGRDYDGNPVFYFRNMCLGPWRKNSDALIASVLHRLESKLVELSRDNPRVQCTLIVLAGKPYQKKSKPDHDTAGTNVLNVANENLDRIEQSTAASTLQGGDEDESTDGKTSDSHNDTPEQNNDTTPANNPRVHSDELWNTHTTKDVVEQLVHILLTHYPERLSKALVVLRHGNMKYVRSAVSGTLAMISLIPSRRTRDKIRFLTRYSDLHTYVDRTQLVTLVGGTQAVDAVNFAYR
jgi:hypothetical protein